MPDEIPDPGHVLKVEIPGNLWRLVCEAARITEMPPKTAFKQIIFRLGFAAARGDVALLGPEYQIAFRRLETQGKIVDPLAVVIDTTKLHHSSKGRSGFVGVYPNGKGFRAEARTVDGGVFTIGTFDTAESAAWQRYKYHRDNNIPYGPFVAELDSARSLLGDEASLEEVLKLTNDTRVVTGKREITLDELGVSK